VTTPAQLRATVLSKAYETFGEPATWTPSGGGDAVLVTVRRRDADDVAAFGDSRAVVASLVLKVRRSDLAAPSQGDTVVLNPDDDPEAMTIIAQPRRGKFGDEWLCEAKRTS
jgi:hypothetical protein